MANSSYTEVWSTASPRSSIISDAVAVAQGIAQVAPDAQQDNVVLEMTPFEWLLEVHGSGVGG